MHAVFYFFYEQYFILLSNNQQQQFMSANVFDILVIIVLAFSAYKGYTKGLIASAASIIALLLGVWGAIHFSDFTAGYLVELIHVQQKYMSIIAFAVTFVLIVIGVHFIAKAVEKVTEAVALGIVNKIVGLAFGVLKAAFIISVILVILNTANEKFRLMDEGFKEESMFYDPIQKFAPSIFHYFKFEDIHENVKDASKALDSIDI